MFGYCAMGSWNMATMPTITMRMAMTMVTIGRLMKNLAMALARPPGLGQRGLDPLAGFHSVDSLDDDPLARFQPLPDDPQGADSLAELNLSHVHRIVGPNHGDLMDALQILHGALRNEQRAFFHVDDGSHLRVLAGTQEIGRVREHTPDADGAGRRPDRAVQDRDRPPIGVRRPVGEGDLEVVLPLAVTTGHRAALAQSEVLLLADRELDINRIDLGDRGEGRAVVDQIADVRVLDPGDAGDRGEHLRPALVELGIVQHGPGLRDVRLIPGHRRLRVREARAGGLHRSHIRQVGLHRVIQLLLADRAALRQRGVAADVELRVLLVRLGPGHVRLGLRDLRLRLLDLRLRLQELGPGLFGGDLIRPGVDLEQKVTGLDARPFLVVLAHEVSGNPGADLRGDVPHRGAHPLAVDRHVLLDHRLDLDYGWERCPGGRGRTATAGGEPRDHDDEQAQKGTGDMRRPSSTHLGGDRPRAERLDRVSAAVPSMQATCERPHLSVARVAQLQGDARVSGRPYAPRRLGAAVVDYNERSVWKTSRSPGQLIRRDPDRTWKRVRNGGHLVGSPHIEDDGGVTRVQPSLEFVGVDSRPPERPQDAVPKG